MVVISKKEISYLFFKGSPSQIKISQLTEKLNNFGLQNDDDKKVISLKNNRNNILTVKKRSIWI